MGISLQGYNNKYMTMKIKQGVTVGEPVDICDNNTATTATKDKLPVGKLVSQNGEYGLIQTTGAMEFKFTGDKPKLGFTFISSDGQGGIKSDEKGRPVIVTEVSGNEKVVTIVM